MSTAIFISYRRSDSPGTTGRLNDALEAYFGDERVFIDVKDLVDGTNYKDAIQAQIDTCEVMLVVIGPGWLACPDEQGGRRIDRDGDIVRHEIATAFRRKIPVIPLLIEGAKLPKPEELPPELRELPERQARKLAYERWSSDVRELCDVLATKHKVPMRAVQPAPSFAMVDARMGGDFMGGDMIVGKKVVTHTEISMPAGAVWRKVRGTLAVLGAVFSILMVIGLVQSREKNDGAHDKRAEFVTGPHDTVADLSGIWTDMQGVRFLAEPLDGGWTITRQREYGMDPDFKARGRLNGNVLEITFHEVDPEDEVQGHGRLELSPDRFTLAGTLYEEDGTEYESVVLTHQN